MLLEPGSVDDAVATLKQALASEVQPNQTSPADSASAKRRTTSDGKPATTSGSNLEKWHGAMPVTRDGLAPFHIIGSVG